MNLSIGRKYKFEIEKINKLGKHSILNHEGVTYYCPLIFSEEGKSIDLIVKNIEDEKVFFDLDIFSYIEEETIISNVTGTNNENPLYGELFLEYNSFPFKMRCHKWIFNKEVNLPTKIPLKIQNHKAGKDFYFDLNDFNHYKFIKDNVYDFKVLKKEEYKDRIKILDEDDDIQYVAKTNFASINIEIGKTHKFRFLGLNKWLHPEFIQDEKTIFLKPTKILKKEEFDFLNQEHLVDNSIKQQYLKQIDIEDNFWVITVSRYLPLVVESYIKRNRIDEAVLGVSVFDKINGFIKGRNLLDKIPLKSSTRLKHGLKFNEKKTEALVNYLTFIKSYNLEDLFNTDIQFHLDYQMKILQSVLNFNLIENIDQYLEKIIVNFNQNKNYNEKSSFQRTINELSYKYFILPYKREIMERFFFDYNDFEKWFSNKNFGEYISLYLETQNYTSDSRQLLRNAFLKSLSKGLKNKKGYIFNYLKNIRKEFIQTNIEENSKVENEFIYINKEINEIGSNYGFYFDEKLFVIIDSHSIHLVNKSIQQNGKTKLRINRAYKNKLYTAHFNLEDNFKLNGKSIFFNKGIIKQKMSSSNAYFITRGIDENFRTIDCLIYPPVRQFHNNNRYKIGEEVDVDYRLNQNNKTVASEAHLEDKYYFSEYENSFDCLVLNKFIIGDKCPICKSEEIEKIDIECYCNNCNNATLEGIEIKLIENNKILFLIKYSIENTYGKSFIDSLRKGDLINFYFREALKYKTQFKEFTIHSHKVIPQSEPKNIMPKKEMINEYKSSFTSSLFSLIEIERLYEKSQIEKDTLREINIRLGSYMKSPKTYLYRFIEDYNKIIESLRKDINVSQSVEEMLTKISSDYSKTLETFPRLNNLYFSLRCLKFYKSPNLKDQLELLEEAVDSNKKLIKLILIKNLIENETENQEFLIDIKKQIIEILQKERTEITFGVTKKDVEKTDNEILLEGISKGISSEGQNLEFKETFMTPVLNNNQRKFINKLESKLEKYQDLSQKEKGSYEAIFDELKQKRKDKLAINDVIFSSIKNICAFLNSNDGKLIFGVRDDNTTVGLAEEYEVSNLDFDTLQQAFENQWQKLVPEHAIFRPYIELNKEIFEEKEFCVVEVKYPYDIKEPCFIRKGQSEEIIYVKNSSTTMPLKGKQIRDWRRKTYSKLSEINYVYLMKDKVNHTKIGHSKNPDKRRGTLMSQDPKIELINKFKLPNKDVAFRIEKYLHKKYEKYQTETGSEWFNLDPFQIQEIIDIVQEQVEVFETN